MHDMNITRNDSSTMTRAERERKAREFRAALALANRTMTAWAEGEGVTPAHVSMTLAGKRESMTLWSKIEAFTRKHYKAA